MGLDIGDKRIGIAISDGQGQIASPRDTIQRDGQGKDIAQLIEIAENENVDEILVGMPYSLDGSTGPQARKVSAFIQGLTERSNIKIKPWDERLSTVAAERAMLEGGLSRARRRRKIDKVAAAYMLQGYLDYRNHRKAAGSQGN